jgi:hypothetical protein
LKQGRDEQYPAGISFPAALQHAFQPYFRADFFHSWPIRFDLAGQFKVIHIWTEFLRYLEFTLINQRFAARAWELLCEDKPEPAT